MSILSYLGIFSLIPFFVKKDDPHIQWHAKQGVALFLASIVVMVALVILTIVLAFAKLSIVGSLLSLVFWIGVLVLSILGMIKAAKGERWLMPVIGPIVHKGA